MISFNRLGNLGHLGNQMFQYASLKGISHKNNTDFCIPHKEDFGKYYPVKSILDNCFNIECNRGISHFTSMMEPKFCFDETFFNIDKDLDIFGYFQSEKYFKHIEEDIRKDFTFLPDIYDLSRDFFESLDEVDILSLHIRRCDYTSNPNHPVQSLEYYESALKYFPKDITVLIFSDDPNWCKDQSLFSDDRFLISEGNDCYSDLCLMSMCKYHIIANSSFSWWGSWLAKSKKTVAPKYWFDGECKTHNTKDLYLSDWILV